MRSILLIAAGVAAGFAIAHQVSKTEGGARLFGEVDARAREFGGAVVDGYRAREAELRAAVAEAEDVVADRLR
jgi:hypothetical protein